MPGGGGSRNASAGARGSVRGGTSDAWNNHNHNHHHDDQPVLSELVVGGVGGGGGGDKGGRTGGGSGGGNGFGRSFSASSSMRDNGFSSGPVTSSGASMAAGLGGRGVVEAGGGSGVASGATDKASLGTLRHLLLALLNKRVSERISVRGAQAHPWMTRMMPRSGEAGFDERMGGRRDAPPPFKQVSCFFVIFSFFFVKIKYWFS